MTGGNAIRSVAIMQPYFFPYAGYYRLLCSSDVFVVYDCVQFPRRGWVHRNLVPDSLARPQWITLPLKKAGRDVLIRQLEFSDDAVVRLRKSLERFPVLSAACRARHPIVDELLDFSDPPVDYLIRQMRRICDELNISCSVIRSSELDIDPQLRGQDRIIAIAKYLSASTYINSPGGRGLYDKTIFKEAGLNLAFLTEYDGSDWSMLYRILTDDFSNLEKEIKSQAILEF